MVGYFSASPSPRKPMTPLTPDGLIALTGNGYERLVMSDQDICDDVLATIPKLKAAVNKDTMGRSWRERKRKNNVDMYELVPGGNEDPNDDLDVAHAIVAKTELRCHLNEVLNVLVNQDSRDYEASMRSLCGKKFKRGKLLFQQRRRFNFRTPNSKPDQQAAKHADSMPQDGLIGVQLMTIRPKIPVRVSTKHKRTQQLVFASCTQQYPSKDRAIHVMKTIPKDAHDQLVSADDRTALRRKLDHIAVGMDFQSDHGDYGAKSHSTKITLYTYASTVPPTDFKAQSDSYRPTATMAATHSEIARQRKAVMNPEAHHVMNTLAKSLRQFESVIRRRRFGFQSFVYFSTEPTDAPKQCFVCSKKFHFYRRDVYCQLCGHAVCTDCAQLYEVEVRVGELRKNRCCIQCVTRVDACVFDDEDLLTALGPVVIDADDSIWDEDYPILDDASLSGTESISSSIQSLEDISGSLYSRDPVERSVALERLAQLVRPEHRETQLQPQPRVHAKNVLKDVDHHLKESVRNLKNQYTADKCAVYDRERDYAYSFNDESPAAPMAPRPEDHKEAARVHHIQESGVLAPDYDHAALDMLARMAATHLNCPIGYVSVINETTQYVIGEYNYPEEAKVVPRDETLCMHGIYAETPMVLKNPRRDMRFAQLPVVKDIGFQFYAGFPIKAPDGSVVASLCTGDTVPHSNITTKDYATMEVLSKLAADLIVPARQSRVNGSVISVV